MPFSSNPAQTTPKTIAYLRVSTIDQDLEKNKSTNLGSVDISKLSRGSYEAAGQWLPE